MKQATHASAGTNRVRKEKGDARNSDIVEMLSELATTEKGRKILDALKNLPDSEKATLRLKGKINNDPELKARANHKEDEKQIASAFDTRDKQLALLSILSKNAPDALLADKIDNLYAKLLKQKDAVNSEFTGKQKKLYDKQVKDAEDDLSSFVGLLHEKVKDDNGNEHEKDWLKDLMDADPSVSQKALSRLEAIQQEFEDFYNQANEDYNSGGVAVSKKYIEEINDILRQYGKQVDQHTAEQEDYETRVKKGEEKAEKERKQREANPQSIEDMSAEKIDELNNLAAEYGFDNYKDLFESMPDYDTRYDDYMTAIDKALDADVAKDTIPEVTDKITPQAYMKAWDEAIDKLWSGTQGVKPFKDKIAALSEQVPELKKAWQQAEAMKSPDAESAKYAYMDAVEDLQRQKDNLYTVMNPRTNADVFNATNLFLKANSGGKLDGFQRMNDRTLKDILVGSRRIPDMLATGKAERKPFAYSNIFKAGKNGRRYNIFNVPGLGKIFAEYDPNSLMSNVTPEIKLSKALNKMASTSAFKKMSKSEQKKALESNPFDYYIDSNNVDDLGVISLSDRGIKEGFDNENFTNSIAELLGTFRPTKSRQLKRKLTPDQFAANRFWSKIGYTRPGVGLKRYETVADKMHAREGAFLRFLANMGGGVFEGDDPFDPRYHRIYMNVNDIPEENRMTVPTPLKARPKQPYEKLSKNMQAIVDDVFNDPDVNPTGIKYDDTINKSWSMLSDDERSLLKALAGKNAEYYKGITSKAAEKRKANILAGIEEFQNMTPEERQASYEDDFFKKQRDAVMRMTARQLTRNALRNNGQYVSERGNAEPSLGDAGYYSRHVETRYDDDGNEVTGIVPDVGSEGMPSEEDMKVIRKAVHDIYKNRKRYGYDENITENQLLNDFLREGGFLNNTYGANSGPEAGTNTARTAARLAGEFGSDISGSGKGGLNPGLENMSVAARQASKQAQFISKAMNSALGRGRLSKEEASGKVNPESVNAVTEATVNLVNSARGDDRNAVQQTMDSAVDVVKANKDAYDANRKTAISNVEQKKANNELIYKSDAIPKSAKGDELARKSTNSSVKTAQSTLDAMRRFLNPNIIAGVKGED